MNRETNILTPERQHGALAERFVCVTPEPGECAVDFFARAADAPGQCVTMDVFGGAPDAATWAAMTEAFAADVPPVTWVIEEGAAPSAVHVAQAWFVEGVPVQRLTRANEILGSVFEDEHARYVRLGGLMPDNAGEPMAQTREVLQTMLALLNEAGLDFSHVVRTWFYLADILDWYGQFNTARDTFFREHAVFEGLVPASTGMGGANRKGRLLNTGLLAVLPKSNRTVASRVDSPLQCPAWDYGSSFSRAVEVATPHARRLLISGTASIAQEGHTLHEGDVVAQMRQTFAVVEAMLDARGMGWGDVTRAVGYFKPGQAPGTVDLLKELAPPMPVVPVINHVCRGDLLFETELEAMVVDDSEDSMEKLA
jgi:enamine deaminase RidA (YjgF/YER057c/UK114 family)